MWLRVLLLAFSTLLLPLLCQPLISHCLKRRRGKTEQREPFCLSKSPRQRCVVLCSFHSQYWMISYGLVYFSPKYFFSTLCEFQFIDWFSRKTSFFPPWNDEFISDYCSSKMCIYFLELSGDQYLLTNGFGVVSLWYLIYQWFALSSSICSPHAAFSCRR